MGHSRIVFNISCDVAGTKIMTVSMDRQVRWYYGDNYVIKFQTKLSECADYKWCEISHSIHKLLQGNCLGKLHKTAQVELWTKNCMAITSSRE